MYEESVTIPFIAAWPEVVAAGQVTTALLSGYDVAATLRELCALPGEDPPGPGRSFAGIPTGQHCEPRDHVVVFDEYGPVRIIRTPNAGNVITWSTRRATPSCARGCAHNSANGLTATLIRSGTASPYP